MIREGMLCTTRIGQETAVVVQVVAVKGRIVRRGSEPAESDTLALFSVRRVDNGRPLKARLARELRPCVVQPQSREVAAPAALGGFVGGLLGSLLGREPRTELRVANGADLAESERMPDPLRPSVPRAPRGECGR
jgi:hypothetical protein